MVILTYITKRRKISHSHFDNRKMSNGHSDKSSQKEENISREGNVTNSKRFGSLGGETEW